MTSMNRFLMVVFGILLFASVSYAVDTKTVTLKTNLTCGSCKDKIETGLKDKAGIQKTEVNVDSKTVKVNYDAEMISEANVTEAIVGLGYTAEVVKDQASDAKESSTEKTSCCSSKKKTSCDTK